MRPSAQAVLARFNGDHRLAFQYCLSTVIDHPHLLREYAEIAEIILDGVDKD